MIVLRNKHFSFVGNLKGNPQLVTTLFGNWNNIRLDEEVKSDLENFKFPIDNNFAKLMQIIYEFAPNTDYNRVGGRISCNFFIRGYKSLIKNIQNPSKTPMGTLKYEKPRVVIGKVAFDNGNLLVSYIPSTKNYILTKENDSYDLISRGIDKLFGDKKFNILLETSDFKDCLRYLEGVKVVTTYYSNSNSEEDKNLKRKIKSQKEIRDDAKTDIAASPIAGAIMGGSGYYLGGKAAGEVSKYKMLNKVSKKIDEINHKARKGDPNAMEVVYKFNSDPQKSLKNINKAIKGSKKYKKSVKGGKIIGTTIGLAPVVLGVGKSINEMNKSKKKIQELEEKRRNLKKK